MSGETAGEKAEIYALALWNIAADLDWTAGELWDRLGAAKKQRTQKISDPRGYYTADLEIPD